MNDLGVFDFSVSDHRLRLPAHSPWGTARRGAEWQNPVKLFTVLERDIESLIFAPGLARNFTSGEPPYKKIVLYSPSIMKLVGLVDVIFRQSANVITTFSAGRSAGCY